MKNRSININDLENYLCDGISISEILDEGRYDALLVLEWNETYFPNEDKRLNRDMRHYLLASYEEESRKAMRNSL